MYVPVCILVCYKYVTFVLVIQSMHHISFYFLWKTKLTFLSYYVAVTTDSHKIRKDLQSDSEHNKTSDHSEAVTRLARDTTISATRVAPRIHKCSHLQSK